MDEGMKWSFGLFERSNSLGMQFSPQFEAFLAQQLQSIAELVVVLVLEAEISWDKVIGQRPHR